MQIKVEEELEPKMSNVVVKDESEDEMTLIKGDDSDLVHTLGESTSSDDGRLTALQPDPHANLFEYLKLVGATQNITNGENIVHDGKIFNPTPEVKKYKYNTEHSFDEGYIDCGINSQNNHWCRFYRNEDLDGIGFRYLNHDKSVFYHNPDHSEYYVDSKREWFRPPPKGLNWKTED